MKKENWRKALLLAKTCTVSEVVFSQEFVLSTLRPLLETQGGHYRKFRPVLARKAKTGERITTNTADGAETTNEAEPGDYLVQNTTEAGEQYLIPEETFSTKYRFLRPAEDGFDQYQPTGEVMALELTSERLHELNWPKEFEFLAKWEEPMRLKAGDFAATPLDFSEIYRIARKEFFETYQLVEGMEG